MTCRGVVASALCMAPVVLCIALSLPVPHRDAHTHRLYPFLSGCLGWQAATIWYLCAVVLILPTALFGGRVECSERLGRRPRSAWVLNGAVCLTLTGVDLARQFLPSTYIHRDWLLDVPGLFLPLAALSPALFATAIRGLEGARPMFVVVALALPAILFDFHLDWRSVSPMADALPLIVRLALMACLARLTVDEAAGLAR